MNKLQTSAIAVLLFVLYGSMTYAQVKAPALTVDSLKHQLSMDSLKNKLKKSFKPDTAALNKVLNVDQTIRDAANQKIRQSPLNKLFKKDSLKTAKKVQLKDFSILNTTQYTTTEKAGLTPNYVNNTGLSGQLTLFKLPVDLDVVKTYNPVNDFSITQNNLFKVGFAKEQLYQLYQGDLDKYKNFKKDKLAGLNPEAFLKKGLQERIQRNMPAEVVSSPKVMAFINDPKALDELMSMNEAQIKAKLANVLTTEETKLKTQATEIYNDQKKAATDLYQDQNKAANAKVQTKVSEITQYVQSVKREISDSGIDPETMGLLQKFAENKIDKQTLQTYYTGQLNKRPEFSAAQKFYSRIKEFQAGNFGHELPGPLRNQDLFLNGVNFSLKTLRGQVSAGVAANKDIGQPKDIGFNRSTFSYPKLFTFLSVPTSNFAFGSGQLSWVGVYDKQFSSTPTDLGFNAIPRNNLVFTLAQNLKVKDLGKLTVDISKSATQYKNLTTIGPDQLFMDRNTNGNYFRDDFLETMSIGVNHAIDSRKLGLNSNVYVNYSGLGFQNPGQQGLNSTNMRYGGNIKQNLFKNKVTLYVKSDLKNTPISADNSAHWKNYNLQLDSRFRLSKGYTLNFKYVENGVNKISDVRAPVYSSKKIQSDFNANYKIAGHYSFSHVTLGRQTVSNAGTMVAGFDNLTIPSLEQPDFMMLNYAQNVLFKNFSLIGNLFYNRELSHTAILGNMLNSDVACQFTLFKTISLSSGITYLDNQSIAKQVGIKQNIQLMLKKHFDVSAYVDLRKNLVNPLYPDLFATGRAEFSIRYYLDQQ